MRPSPKVTAWPLANFIEDLLSRMSSRRLGSLWWTVSMLIYLAARWTALLTDDQRGPPLLVPPEKSTLGSKIDQHCWGMCRVRTLRSTHDPPLPSTTLRNESDCRM